MKTKIYFITMLCIVFALKGYGQCIPSIVNQPTSNQGLCNAQFGTIATNGIGCNCGYFSEVLSQTICVTPGVAYALNASATTQFGGTAAMWFDANQDNLFSLSELVFNGQASTQYSFSLPANIAAGQYKVRVITNGSSGISSANSCGSYYDGQDFEFTVAHSVPNNISISSSSALPCVNTTQTLSVVNTGTTAITGYNWGWTTVDNIVGTNTLSTVNLTSAYAGVNYINNVEVTYGNGCKNTASFSYTVNPTPTGFNFGIVGATSSSLCANTISTLNYSGNFFGTVTNNLWSTGSTALTTTVSVGNSPVTTTLNITRADGCTFTYTGTIPTGTTIPAPPTGPNITPSSTICANTNVVVSFSGPSNPGFTYNWNNGTTGSFKQFHPSSDTVLYISYYKNGFACPGQLNRTITVTPSPTVSVSNGTICAGSSFTISPSGATIYGYSGGSAVVAPTASLTTYTVTGYTGSCSDTETLTVAVVASPTVIVSNGTICSGNSFTISPTGATSYTYSSGSAIVSPSATTVYSVTGANGSCSQTKTVSVTVNTTPTVSASNGTICSGASFNLNPTGAGTYTISGGSATVSPTTTTSYTVNGTSAQGCINQSAIIAIVTVNTTPTITASNGTICAGNSFTINPSGATSYTYSGGGSAVVSPTTNTTYVVTGSNGLCSSTKNLTVTVNPAPFVGFNVGAGYANNLCPNEPLNIPLFGTNNAQNFTLNGSSIPVPTSGIVISPSITTVYTMVATNTITGCAATFSITGTVKTRTINITTTNTLLCVGQTATLLATASGAGGLYYVWTGGNSSFTGDNVVSPTTTTIYTVNAVDNNMGNTNNTNCSYPATFTQSVSTCTSIDEATNNNLVSIYPNPANDFMNVSLVTESADATTIYIINALGEIVLTEKGTLSNTTFNIDKLTNGVYFVKVESKNASAIKKFIKN